MEEKRYYVEWVIVGGEIAVGDYVVHVITKERKHIVDNDMLLQTSPRDRKAKLFMCDSMVIIGDMVYARESDNPPFYGKITAFSVDKSVCQVAPMNKNLNSRVWHTKRCIKVVGEIDPKAIWIKQGDRYNEEDLIRHAKCCGTANNAQCLDCPHYTETISVRRRNKHYHRIVKEKCKQVFQLSVLRKPGKHDYPTSCLPQFSVCFSMQQSSC